VNPAPVVKAKDVASKRAGGAARGANDGGRPPPSQKRRRGEVFPFAAPVGRRRRRDVRSGGLELISHQLLIFNRP
jgi:hypothetical protein